jgi:hypothetical protein
MHQKITGSIVRSMLLLRQSCCHPQVGAHGTSTLGTKARSMEELLAFMLKRASDELQGSSQRIVDIYLELAATSDLTGLPAVAMVWYQKARDIAAAEIASKRMAIAAQKERAAGDSQAATTGEANATTTTMTTMAEQTDDNDQHHMDADEAATNTGLRANFSAWVDRDLHALHHMIKITASRPELCDKKADDSDRRDNWIALVRGTYGSA